MVTLIQKYFSRLTPLQADQFARLEPLYREWNAMINVISRKDIEHLAIHHVLHSLSVAKIISFEPGTAIMDAGTGGGFPGIPLAILFPEARFTLVDSIEKKVKVVKAISTELGLENVTVTHARFETVREKFDFVTGRAVSNLPLFYSMVKGAIRKGGTQKIHNGILYLTGGEVDAGLADIKAMSSVYNISEWFGEDFFPTKRLVHIYNL